MINILKRLVNKMISQKVEIPPPTIVFHANTLNLIKYIYIQFKQ